MYTLVKLGTFGMSFLKENVNLQWGKSCLALIVKYSFLKFSSYLQKYSLSDIFWVLMMWTWCKMMFKVFSLNVIKYISSLLYALTMRNLKSRKDYHKCKMNGIYATHRILGIWISSITIKEVFRYICVTHLGQVIIYFKFVYLLVFV